MNMSEEKVTALSWRVFRQDVARPGASAERVTPDGSMVRWRFLGVGGDANGSPHVPAAGVYQQSGYLLLEVPTDGDSAAVRTPCLAYLKVL